MQETVRPIASEQKETRPALYGRYGGSMFAARRVQLDGRTYEADADGRVYSIGDRGPRRRVRDRGILGRVDRALRQEREARAAAAAKAAS